MLPALCGPLSARTIVVTLDGTGDYRDIGAALAASAEGDEIVVKPGEYVITEPLDFTGFSGITLRSEPVSMPTVIRMADDPLTPARASVIVLNGAESIVIDGFTLAGGRGTRHLGQQRGGAILCVNGSSAIVRDCYIARNTAFEGCGVCCRDSSLVLADCRVKSNLVVPTTGDQARPSGSGVYAYRSSLTLAGCRIYGNGTDGISAEFESTVSMSGCTIAENNGGGVTITAMSTGSIVACQILGNIASRGGGLYVQLATSVSVINSVIGGNRALCCGGAMVLADASARLVNCTISGNIADGQGVVGDEGGGGIACSLGGRVSTLNCIVWGNTPESICGEASHTLTDIDPLFVARGRYDFERVREETIQGERFLLPDFVLEEPDFRLQVDSMAIDRGMLDGAPAQDIDGNGRPCGKNVDLGAYESGECAASNRFVRGDSNVDSRVDIADSVHTLNFLFRGGVEVSCQDAADANDDGTIDISDAVYTLAFLFTGENRGLPTPGPECGLDPTADTQVDCAYDPLQC